MRLLLVRYGQDESEYQGGWSERGLTEQGWGQAQALAQALLGQWQPLDLLISSDLRLAAETTAFIQKALPDLPVRYDAAWREMNNGELAGMLNSEALLRYPGLYFSSLRMDETYPSGESPHQFFERVKTAFQQP
jgi:probable phosphoglycerate mutase